MAALFNSRYMNAGSGLHNCRTSYPMVNHRLRNIIKNLYAFFMNPFAKLVYDIDNLSVFCSKFL